MSSTCAICKTHYSEKTQIYIPGCASHSETLCPRISSCSLCGSLSHSSAKCKYYETGTHPMLSASAPPRRIKTDGIENEHVMYIPTEDKPLRALMKKMGIPTSRKREHNLDAIKIWCQEQNIKAHFKA